MTRDFQIFGTACCIGVPLLAFWAKMKLWEIQARVSRGA